MHVLFSAAVIACPLRTTYCPGSDSLILDTKTVHSKEDEGKLQSWTKVGILLNFWGVFQFTHTLPLPSPHKQHWTHVSRIFSQLQLCIGWGEGELQENFEKDALFDDNLCTDNLFSPQIFTEERRKGGGGSVHRVFYEGAQKLEKVMNTTMNTEIMNTFPKTFVQDCSYFYHHYLPSSHVCFFIFL